ncbi:MAG: lyase family protein [Bacteroidetes bacterium]|nr:lyase family protein [Bacteroidota bacterium]
MRKESDFIGEREIPEDVFYGIHALRARENFPDITPFPVEWYKAIGLVKQACYLTYKDFKKAAIGKYKEEKISFHFFEDQIIEALIDASKEVSEGEWFDHFIVPAISGGAGTSINMNINEIIANTALTKMGKHPGEYSLIDPVEHANVFQSTNDVIPTSLHIALMFLLNELETGINELRTIVEKHENSNRNNLRIGYTQMQEAVPSSYGKLFSTYSEALSRDWWRVSKCFERIKPINLGGSAIGTGLAVPLFFIMEAVNHLQKLTGLPIARSENLADATSNLDSLVEVHAILKAHAVNLEKMVSDLRLLASDLLGRNELHLPQKQVGSSIMPGKINPVIPEFVISVSHRVYSNDTLIASLCAAGCLELNAYLPVIGISFIESLKLLIAADKTLKENLFEGLKVDIHIGEEKLFNSPSITTALVPYIGYHKASLIAKEMKVSGITIFEANTKLNLIDEVHLKQILKPENLLKLGYSLGDLT